MLIEGPAGTGKTLGIGFKLHLCAEKWPGSRILIARKTRASLNETVIPLFNDTLYRPGHPCWRGDVDPKSVDSFRYPNGSRIVLGGLDNVTRIMSSDYDLIYVPEATEVTQEDVEMLNTRKRGRRAIPFKQTILDCNPGPPTHWMAPGVWPEGERYLRLRSKHEDNPVLHDGTDWTEDGREYLATLSEMSGARRQRMLEGLWVAQEGAVFESLCEAHNFTLSEWSKGFPEHVRLIVGYDWGVAAPFAAVVWALDYTTHTAYAVAEVYEAGLSIDQQAAKLASILERVPKIEAIYYDPAMGAREARGIDGQYGEAPVTALDRAIRHRGVTCLLSPGINRTRLANIDFLNTMQHMTLTPIPGRWKMRIARERCPKLWGEFQSAVWYQTKTGEYIEDLAPACPDHAITASYYALRTHLTGHNVSVGSGTSNPYKSGGLGRAIR